MLRSFFQNSMCCSSRMFVLALTVLNLAPRLFAAEQEGQETAEAEYVGLQNFVTRPDIQCASWNVSIYDKAALASGYWFIAPYESNGFKARTGSWIGPHIYDNNGGLIWSGSPMFNQTNIMDFLPMNVHGENLLSMSHIADGTGYILDTQYRVSQTVSEGTHGKTYNMHDFHTVAENGSRFLYLQRNVTYATVGPSDLPGFVGECLVEFPGFEERDAKTGEVLFKWDGYGIIPLSDSTCAISPLNGGCGNSFWDYLHPNSIDKFSDGHYLLSARHADTLYKISKDDGSIIWRLQGQGKGMSDFQMIGNLNFSRQHHARIQEQNDTHTVISLLDNAIGQDPQPATAGWSRGLSVALREDAMTAELVANYDHPRKELTPRRGSFQALPNGNVFVGWSEHALQSEHTADGRLIMEAELTESKLGTYRAFKFPFVAHPDYPPDVHSNASSAGATTSTAIYVSWNGATEVANWIFYKCNDRGDRSFWLDSVPRLAFETRVLHNGYAKYVFVEAQDGAGNSLGRSRVFETLVHGEISSVAVAEELLWLQSSNNRMWSVPWVVFMGSMICGIALSAAVLRKTCKYLRRHYRIGNTYERVSSGEPVESDGTQLFDVSSNTSYYDVCDEEIVG